MIFLLTEWRQNYADRHLDRGVSVEILLHSDTYFFGKLVSKADPTLVQVTCIHIMYILLSYLHHFIKIYVRL